MMKLSPNLAFAFVSLAVGAYLTSAGFAPAANVSFLIAGVLGCRWCEVEPQRTKLLRKSVEQQNLTAIIDGQHRRLAELEEQLNAIRYVRRISNASLFN